MSRTQREKSQGKSRSVKLFGKNGRHFKHSGDDVGDSNRRGHTHFLRINRRHNQHLSEDFLSGYAD